jgi:CIC family chloride channel protein
LLASIVGALVVQATISKQPAFTLTGVEAPTWMVYVLTPPVAAAAALVGVLFQKGTMNLRLRRRELKHVPPWARPCLGGLITWALGSAIFLTTNHLGVFGLGYGDLSAGLGHQLTWQIAAILLGAKLVATEACYGLGGCGGIFSPTLFLGGMSGICLAGLWTLVVPMNTPDQLALAVVGMAACLGAVVRAPVTGILIVFEMTHEFSLVPALMLGALVSQSISRKMNRLSFYDEVLAQDGHEVEHVIPPRDLQSWQQLPVSAVANFKPVIASDLAPAEVKKLLAAHPYGRFPVLVNGRLSGILTRPEGEKAVAENRAARSEPAVTCLPHQTIRELEAKIIESASLIVILLDQPDGKVLGLLTLHDLLRAQVALADGGPG